MLQDPSLEQATKRPNAVNGHRKLCRDFNRHGSRRVLRPSPDAVTRPHIAGGATTAVWPLRLSASATKPEALTSSTKAARYFAPAERALPSTLGVPMAWRISWNAPAITRISGWALA